MDERQRDGVPPVGTSASTGATTPPPLGGTVGIRRRLGRGARALPGAAVALLASVMLLAGFAQRLPCTQSVRGAGGLPQLDWSNGRQLTYLCYTDVIPLYTADRIAEPGAFPYATSWAAEPGNRAGSRAYVQYPVLIGLFMWLNGRLAALVRGLPGTGGLAPVVLYFDLVVLWLAGCWLLVVAAVRKLSASRPQDALLVALSPLVLDQMYTNFDALAVAFATAGLLAWSRRRPLLAGALLGLGGAVKLYPLLLLVPLLALCLRAGRLREGLRALAGALAAFALVNLPIAVLHPAGWSYFYRFSALRAAGFESLYNIVSHFTGATLEGHLAPGRAPNLLNGVSAGLFALACAAICWVALSAPRRPRLAPLCLLVLAAFLLASKVYSPQYSLWLVPVAALALPRWRVLLPWMLIDALVWVPTMLFARASIGEGYFLGAVLVRDAALLAVCAAVIAEIYAPRRDRVRAGGRDDPVGGALDGAPDRVVLPRGRLRAAA